MDNFSEGLTMGMVIGDSRESTIAELEKKGSILPLYDWQDKNFQATVELITADWFKRHPETIRGSGAFQKKYPNKENCFNTLDKMVNKRQITPDEFIIIYRAAFDF